MTLVTTTFLGPHSLGLLWEITKGDIHNTLRRVCIKVLRDRSVSSDIRRRRASALYKLGEVYASHQVGESKALRELTERLGTQTGFYGAAAETDFSAFGQQPSAEEKSNSKDAGGVAAGADPEEVLVELVALQSRVDDMTIKELKQRVAELGGDPSQCIEKSDLRRRLHELLDAKVQAVAH